MYLILFKIKINKLKFLKKIPQSKIPFLDNKWYEFSEGRDLKRYSILENLKYHLKLDNLKFLALSRGFEMHLKSMKLNFVAYS